MRPLPIAALSLLAACTSADVLRVAPTPEPMPGRESVPILLDEPKEPYYSIAMVEVSGSWASLERIGKRLAKEAAKLGGDAVLIIRRSAFPTSTVIPLGDSFATINDTDSRLVGKVIVFNASAVASRP